MSTNRVMKRDALKKGPNGRNLCRWCKAECPRSRQTFCHDPKKNCLHEYKLRRNPQYLRMEVLKRDHGICSDCGIDTLALMKELNKLLHEDRAKWQMLNTQGTRVDYAGIPHEQRYFSLCQRLQEVNISFKAFESRSSLWDADHIKPVVEGGGECALDNIRTLCLGCHGKRTAELRERIKTARRAGTLPPKVKPEPKLYGMEPEPGPRPPGNPPI